ncbi:MAG: argininosuccinate synthase [Planctomycetes bacterium]|nr:argininosuccinate synthase [Planctomycetota bacterium]
MAKVVLAYSGDLDTAVTLHWLRHKQGHEVATFSANLGQGRYLEPVGEVAIEAGAVMAHVGDLRQKFVEDFIVPVIRSGARYESGYFLSSALSRPLIVAEMIKIAVEDGYEFIAHGGSHLGNDAVRFETCARALNPRIQILAPLREGPFGTYEDLRDYALRNEVRHAGGDARFGVERNLWGRSVVCRETRDPWVDIPEEAFELTRRAGEAPAEGVSLTVGFEEGVPRTLNGEPVSRLALLERLNEIGGGHGVGRVVAVENRLTGLKSREVYEAPAATLIHVAHRALEDLTLGKELLHYKPLLSRKYAELVYNGLWFTELRRALDAFFLETQRYVTGEVRLRLQGTSCSAAGVRSDYSLYDHLAQPGAPAPDRSAMKGFAEVVSMASRGESRPMRPRVGG